MLVVAVASENDEFDAPVYARLAGLLLHYPVLHWRSDLTFAGWRSVARLTPAYLHAASARGVRHAIVAVDNDGGAKRRLEHEPTRCVVPVPLDDEDGCRHCWADSVVPEWWKEPDFLHVVAVPVQVIETWLLAILGFPFGNTGVPESYYGRTYLKREFDGRPKPPVAQRVKKAIDAIERPGALDILRRRPSFVRFEVAVSRWVSSLPPSGLPTGSDKQNVTATLQ